MAKRKMLLPKFSSYANTAGTVESRIKHQARVDELLGIDTMKKRPEPQYKGILPPPKPKKEE